MTLEELYEMIGGDYRSTKSRFMTDERILRFVRKFPLDQSYRLLESSLSTGDQAEAFRAAHTLKGVAQNLGFTALYEIASSVTEVLRGGGTATADQLDELKIKYDLVIDSIPLVADR